jgi:kynureninase
MKPKENELTLNLDDILNQIDKEGDEISMILFCGIQYLTGQLLDIKQITQMAHRKGCLIGWDLAHAVGNVNLNLHEWNVDFAAWCTYKVDILKLIFFSNSKSK